MGLILRALLTWLLVLAVPLQGAAAATLGFCGSDHHRSPVASGHEHGHDHPAAVADGDTHAVATTAAAAEASHAGKHTCSACASCCANTAMLSPAWVAPTLSFGAGVFFTVVPEVEPFAADGPDRPPRPVLA
ncbi:MAG: hypothetical protein ACOVOT_05460 [Rubrivivax sp.]|jgi:hypothetical protein|nr:hypothetical protein [Rubrivivax sp.]